ncbi:MAG: response regulator, partial [Acidobacteriales bacterium]
MPTVSLPSRSTWWAFSKPWSRSTTTGSAWRSFRGPRPMGSAPTSILLIEDNPADARLIQETLSEEGAAAMDVRWAELLSTGLKQLTEADPDVVLLDLSLPDSQGLDTFLKLRAQVPNIPVIV